MKKENLDVSAFAGMHGQEHTRILDTIDRMRDLGINEDLSIPQVSVC